MTVPEVLQRANQYIVVEAIISSKSKEMHKTPHQEPSLMPTLSSPRWRKHCLLEISHPRSRSMPLNMTRTKICLQIKEKRPTTDEDKSKYYCFHIDYGHNMEESHDLKEQIQELIH